jgi:hypothetical protein
MWILPPFHVSYVAEIKLGSFLLNELANTTTAGGDKQPYVSFSCHPRCPRFRPVSSRSGRLARTERADDEERLSACAERRPACDRSPPPRTCLLHGTSICAGIPFGLTRG